MHLNAKVAFLKYNSLATGSHFSSFSAGVTWSNFLVSQTTRQALFVNVTLKLLGCTKPALRQFLRLSLARFSCEMGCLLSLKNLAKKSLRNCNVRQVLCILYNFLPFQTQKTFVFFQNSRVFSCLNLKNLVKKSLSLWSKYFSNFPSLSRN